MTLYLIIYHRSRINATNCNLFLVLSDNVEVIYSITTIVCKNYSILALIILVEGSPSVCCWRCYNWCSILMATLSDKITGMPFAS